MGFSERLQKVAREKKLDQKDIADGLAIFPATVNRWWNGKVMPRGKSLRSLAEFLSCSIEWLETGEGQMFGYQPPPGDAIRLDFQSKSPKQNDMEEMTTADLPEMIKMTTAVLLSDTVYKPALASNIRAFHKAVTMEGEMKELKNDVRQIKQQNAEISSQNSALREDLRALTEALLAAGIAIPKRDTAA